MKRFMFALGAVVAFGAVVTPAEAQIKFGVEGAYIAGGYGDLVDAIGDDADLSGDFGLGGRLALQPPMLPVGVYGEAVYFFPSCAADTDCSYWAMSLGGQLGLPLPMLRPYVLGGWQWKRYGVDGSGSTENNAFAGLGVQLNMLAGLFIEGSWEFDGTVEGLTTTAGEISTTPFVLKAGFMFGG